MISAQTGTDTSSVRPRSGGMSLAQTIRIAWRAIRSNPMRSILTALGVIIGVAAVIALTSLGAGATSGIQKQLESLGTNLLTVSSGAARRGGAGGLVRTGNQATITLEDVRAIEALDGVAAIAPNLQRNIQVKAGANNTNATVIGTWPGYASVRNAETDQGAWFGEGEIAAGRRVAVIGYQIAEDIFSGNALGQTLRLNGVSYTVVGVLPDKGSSGFNSPNTQVFIPLTTFQRRIQNEVNASGKQTVSSVFIQGNDQNTLSELQTQISDLIADRHGQSNPDEYDFTVQNQADALSSLNQITTTLTLFLGGIAGISLLVGGIGIMNIMLVSVTERTREIGIRKALGAKPRNILTQFLVEAVVLSVGGGAIGIAVGLGLASGVGSVLNMQSVVNPSSIVIAFGFSAAVGVFFGFYPAARASKLDPIEALRYE